MPINQAIALNNLQMLELNVTLSDHHPIKIMARLNKSFLVVLSLRHTTNTSSQHTCSTQYVPRMSLTSTYLMIKITRQILSLCPPNSQESQTQKGELTCLNHTVGKWMHGNKSLQPVSRVLALHSDAFLLSMAL